MGIDFHYGVLYYLARLAGLSLHQAKTVAHASQYVNDATTEDALQFEDGQVFEPIASAHSTFDFKREIDEKDCQVSASFHLLPAAQGDSLQEQAVCRPNSQVGQALIRDALQARSASNGLHRLGVALHAYAATWANQGFSGVVSDSNRIIWLEADDFPDWMWFSKLTRSLTHAGDAQPDMTIDHFSGLGRAAALQFPDLPWAHWTYTTVTGQTVARHNLPDYLEAANMIYKVLAAFQAGSEDFLRFSDLPAQALTSLSIALANNKDHDEETRLHRFGCALANGMLAGVREPLPRYIKKGPGSWQSEAIGLIDDECAGDKPRWSPAFEDSDYRKFHEALKTQQFTVVQEILPRFGLHLA
ncbi:MAG: hypothetical protein JOY60_11700 [Burkholderiaceae bacterium]|nr:hypothetical protein [Burkholderiaceae bacterium]